MDKDTSTLIDSLRFPLGKAPEVLAYNPERVAAQIERIAKLPGLLKAEVQSVRDEQAWLRPYRPEGWTALEVIHHLPDSHMHAYARFKFSLTEETPEIKPYEETRWVQLPDAVFAGVNEALAMVEAIHAKWVRLMRGLASEGWERGYYHPGYRKTFSLYQAASLYAWHGEHHLQHIRNAIHKAS